MVVIGQCALSPAPDVIPAPGGSSRVLTNNTDRRGTPGPYDDHNMRIER